MRKYLVTGILLLVTLFGYAHAALIDINNSRGHVVYDDVAYQYWIWDLRLLSGGLSYSEQIDKIGSAFNSSSYFEINSWHMASLSEMSGLWANSASDINLFQYTYVLGGKDYRSGRYDSIAGEGQHYRAIAFEPFAPTGYSNYTKLPLETYWMPDIPTSYSGPDTYLVSAWVTADSPNTVPEPATLALLCIGLLTSMVYRKRILK